MRVIYVTNYVTAERKPDVGGPIMQADRVRLGGTNIWIGTNWNTTNIQARPATPAEQAVIDAELKDWEKLKQ